ncbi:hypothetical protein PCE1_002301 [Barthelona sp. PCE]
MQAFNQIGEPVPLAQARGNNVRDDFTLDQLFLVFILEFCPDNEFIYRNQLLENVAAGSYHVDVDLEHLAVHNEELTEVLQGDPSQHLPAFEMGATEALKRLSTIQDIEDIDRKGISVHVRLVDYRKDSHEMRNLQPDDLHKVVHISGIISGCGRITPKMKELHLRCSVCGHRKIVVMAAGSRAVKLPQCQNMAGQYDEQNNHLKCPLNSYRTDPMMSRKISVQTVKLQETPEMVPVGEMPVIVPVYLERTLCGAVQPGERVNIIGRYDIAQIRSARTVSIIAFGIRPQTVSSTKNISADEIEKFKLMSADPAVKSRIIRSIAPAMKGLSHVKTAIAVMMFGGNRKAVSGLTIRGDINVLLLGDPSCGKSQFLKFVEACAPISVLTSGKGSSAAGLTALVKRDRDTGEFVLEGGAMVLADGGVVCIDEMDKMRGTDLVAIHEAMEQQTISVAKAGISTVLNSRCAVLGAANPTFGSFSASHSIDDNVAFKSTILSRFDLIFFMKDEVDGKKDRALARHIMDTHSAGTTEVDLEVATLKKYIAYAKEHVHPVIDQDTAHSIRMFYTQMRQDAMHAQKNGTPAIPIAIRQLEALIRLTEAFAKMELCDVATTRHFGYAQELFRVSTMKAVMENNLEMEGMSKNIMDGSQKELQEEMQRVLEESSDGQMTQSAFINRLTKSGYEVNDIKRLLQASQLFDTSQKNIVILNKNR